jgi:CheY-like chemotaxis protein
MTTRTTALIVEDEPQLRRLMSRLLERAGYATLAAPTAAEGLRMFRERSESIGLVLLDVVLPRSGAEEMLPLLLSERRDLRIILTSGDVLPDSLARALARSGGRFLPKPFAPRTLMHLIAAPDPGASNPIADLPSTNLRGPA